MFHPVLFLGVAADGIAAFILFAFFERHREIRGRVLPSCILTLIHALLIPSFMFIDADRSGLENTIADVVEGGYVLSPLVLMLFGLIYTIALSEHTRMTRPLGISCLVFNANMILQCLLVLALVISICD